MLEAFLYLTACSMRNRLRVRLQRLRQPRYLIGSIVGGLYLYATVFRHAFGPSRGGPPGLLALVDRVSGPIEFVGTVFLFVIAMGAWIAPGAGRPIEFTRSEVQFLFQAPLSRRQLLHYKLLRGQLGVLFASAIATLFLRPQTLATAWTFLVGMWLLFAILRLHFIGVALRRQSLLRHGSSGVQRQWVPLGVVIAALALLAASVARDWPAMSTMATASEVFEELRRIASVGPAAWVLWPFRAMVRLPLAGTTEAFLRALPGGLLLLLLNYIWVLRGDAAFEEASAAYAERRATDRAAPSSVRRQVKATVPPFTLAATGRPEIAILWKNLIMLGRYASLRVLARVLPAVLVLAVVFARNGARGGTAALIGATSLMLAGMAVLLGPQIVRNDLRQDLASLPVLKTWPIRGAVLIRGELLAPAAILTLFTWLLILVAGLFMAPPGPVRLLPAGWRLIYGVAAMCVAPGIILAQLVIQNAIAVLFPAWGTVGASRARGIDAMGQRLLLMAGVLVTLVLSILPAGAAAAAVGLAIYAATHSIPVVLPALVIAGVMVAECVLATEALGRVLDRTDVSALEPAES